MVCGLSSSSSPTPLASSWAPLWDALVQEELLVLLIMVVMQGAAEGEAGISISSYSGSP